MATDTRDALRAKLLGTKARRRELITIFDTEIEVIQPTLGEIIAVNTDGTNNDVADMMIRYCYVPGTEVRIFDEADKEVILSWPVDSWLPVMTAAVEKLSGVDVETARKK